MANEKLKVGDDIECYFFGRWRVGKLLKIAHKRFTVELWVPYGVKQHRVAVVKKDLVRPYERADRKPA
jgi:hypothetical protein